MFLKNLAKDEKENFLELAFIVANFNDDFALEQQELIEAYRSEMELTEEDYAIENKAIDEVIEFFIGKDISIRRAVFIEIKGLAISDKNFDEKEKEIITKIQYGLSISDEFAKQASEWVKKMQLLMEEVSELIINKDL